LGLRAGPDAAAVLPEHHQASAHGGAEFPAVDGKAFGMNSPALTENQAPSLALAPLHGECGHRFLTDAERLTAAGRMLARVRAAGLKDREEGVIGSAWFSKVVVGEFRSLKREFFGPRGV